MPVRRGHNVQPSHAAVSTTATTTTPRRSSSRNEHTSRPKRSSVSPQRRVQPPASASAATVVVAPINEVNLGVAGGEAGVVVPLASAELLKAVSRYEAHGAAGSGAGGRSSSASGGTSVAGNGPPLLVDKLSLRGRHVDRDNLYDVEAVVRRAKGRLKALDLAMTRCGGPAACLIVASMDDAGDSDAGHAADGLRSTVHTLDLSFCDVGVTAMPALAKALSSPLSRVRTLTLKYNPITAQGLGILLKWGSTLTRISCQFCGILNHADGRETGLAFVLEGLRENTVCNLLELEGNGFVGAEQQRVLEEVQHNTRSGLRSGGVRFQDARMDEMTRMECPHLARYLGYADAHNTDVAAGSYLTPDGDVGSWCGADFLPSPSLEHAVLLEVCALEAFVDTLRRSDYAAAATAPDGVTVPAADRQGTGSPAAQQLRLNIQNHQRLGGGAAVSRVHASSAADSGGGGGGGSGSGAVASAAASVSRGGGGDAGPYNAMGGESAGVSVPLCTWVTSPADSALSGAAPPAPLPPARALQTQQQEGPGEAAARRQARALAVGGAEGNGHPHGGLPPRGFPAANVDYRPHRQQRHPAPRRGADDDSVHLGANHHHTPSHASESVGGGGGVRDRRPAGPVGYPVSERGDDDMHPRELTISPYVSPPPGRRDPAPASAAAAAAAAAAAGPAGGGGGDRSSRDRITPAILNACLSSDDACRVLLGATAFSCLPADAGVKLGVPEAVVSCCGLPSVLNHLRLGCDERITGIAKLLSIVLVTPCTVTRSEESAALDDIARVAEQHEDAVYIAIRSRSGYDTSRREENRKARTLLRVLRQRTREGRDWRISDREYRRSNSPPKAPPLDGVGRRSSSRRGRDGGGDAFARADTSRSARSASRGGGTGSRKPRSRSEGKRAGSVRAKAPATPVSSALSPQSVPGRKSLGEGKRSSSQPPFGVGARREVAEPAPIFKASRAPLVSPKAAARRHEPDRVASLSTGLLGGYRPPESARYLVRQPESSAWAGGGGTDAAVPGHPITRFTSPAAPRSSAAVGHAYYKHIDDY